MVIRKFIIALVVKYSGKGFDDAERDMKGVRNAAKSAERQIKKLDKAQDDAAASAKRLAADESTAAKAERNAATAAVTAAKANKRLATETRKADKAAKHATGRLTGSGGLAGSFKQLGPLAGTAARGIGVMVAGLALAGAAVLKVGSDFESLRAQLNNLLGSETLGADAFKGIQKFAKETPFQIQGITSSYIKLQNQGIKPTEERLTALGDIAAANGKELSDITEAALDAAVGENERLKEFGIKAKTSNDKVAFSFRGTTIEVDKNREAITGALIKIGQMPGVAGSMAAQMVTTKGVVSNLTDGFMTFLDTVSQLGVIEEFKGLLKDVGKIGGDGDGLAGTLANSLVRVLKALREAIQSITKEQVEEFFHGILEIAKLVSSAIDILVTSFQFLIDKTGGLEQAMIALSLGIFAVQAAFMGPAGLVVAAAAAGAAIGLVLNEMLQADDRLERLLEKVTGLDAFLTRLEGRSGGMTKVRGAPVPEGGPVKKEQTFDLAEAAATSALARAEAKGLSKEAGQFFAQQAREDVRAEVRDEGGRLNAGGTGRGGTGTIATFAGLQSASRGEGVGQSPLIQAAAQSALEQFVGAGTLSESKKTAEEKISKRRKPKRKGKKGKADPFDFAAKAGKAAQSQAQEFAEREVEILVSSGVESGQAIKQAAAAGREKQAELTAKFLQAGKIFATDTNNILDILGLNAPGSMLEGRAPPTSLIISPNIEINMIKEFIQTNTLSGGAKQLEEVTGAGGKAAVTAGVEGFRPIVQEMIDSTINLNMNRLIKMAAGGRQPSGPQG